MKDCSISRACLSILAAGMFSVPSVFGQETFPLNGTADKDLVQTRFEHAVVHVAPGEVIADGTILVSEGRIVWVGPSSEAPGSGVAVVEDMQGFHVYASFVDLVSDYGMPKTQPADWTGKSQPLSAKLGAFGWNEAVRPETQGAEVFVPDEERAKALRAAGFGAVVAHVEDGIVRGTGALVALTADPRQAVIAPMASSHFSFRKGSSSQNYPSSLMGSIALLKQTQFDSDWYANTSSAEGRRETNLSLEAFAQQQALPQIFAAGGWQDALRADRTRREMGRSEPFITYVGGDAYQRLEALAATRARFIVSVDFPAAFDVSDPYRSRMIGLDELKDWELAPENPARMQAAGLPFVLTADGLEKPSMLIGAVRRAVQRGWSAEDALAALTTRPAEWLGKGDRLGAIRAGCEANLLVTDDELFSEDSKAVLYENWVQGEQFVLKSRDALDIAGAYSMTINHKPSGADDALTLTVEGEPGKWKGRVELVAGGDTLTAKMKVKLDGRAITLETTLDTLDLGWLRMSGQVWMDSRIWEGEALNVDGSWVNWSAIRATDDESEQAEIAPADEIETSPGELIWPFKAYGRTAVPTRETVWISGATVWTLEEEGVLEGADVVLHDGKILAVGRALQEADVFGSQVPEYRRIDARGMQLTPGIIDEHSHIAISRGVNEGSQASSAEVEIGSAVNSEDVNIYRQLAGGVTTSQLLHGSANPIGGQSALIKLRWGLTPDEMLFEGADGFIKFALGENVKQSNWGRGHQTRFPQTRMGVEQVYYDYFFQAREYDEAWREYERAMDRLTRRQRRGGDLPVAPRRDLELETLAEILKSERFVTCHSYRQDEINMLMHVADSLGFKINTFTHILEGYKVADKLAAHGAGGSSFSDWWAYKFEVKDAIPYNGAVLHGQGVVTAFNSDDAEMARRLNQEAAKAVKYGGVSEVEALKFVTLNPAKLLHIDHRVGSIAVGKDADVVLWTDHPLSVYAQVDLSFIDGICYYSAAEDVELRETMAEERARILWKMKQAGDDGPPGAKPRKPMERIPPHYHCDTLTDENR